MHATLVRMDCWRPRCGLQVARGVTVMDYEAENEKLRALLKAANERAEAQLPLPTELVALKPAAFNAGVNYELLAAGICTAVSAVAG